MTPKTLLSLLLALCAPLLRAEDLAAGFRDPPAAARPHAWWHWMNGNVSREGIVADLDAMARIGLGGVTIFDAGEGIPAGPLAFGSREWFETVAFAAAEAKRRGMEVVLSNCSGWSSSGGPWVAPSNGMMTVEWAARAVEGPGRFEGPLPPLRRPHGYAKDIAVLAVPEEGPRRKIEDLDLKSLRHRYYYPWTKRWEIPEGRVVPKARVVSLRVAGGRVAWDVPPGRWTILRVFFAANGARNHPASAKGAGLECDKLSAAAVAAHFEAYAGRAADLANGGKPPAGTGLTGVLVDSYEVGSQNWTDGFERDFAARRGYDITPYLPVLCGYTVGDAAETERFLGDFRRTVADLFAERYAGTLARKCAERGLALHLEPYGNAPCDDYAYGRWADVPMCEFRAQPGRELVVGNAKYAADLAHAWGRRVVAAEAYTARPQHGRWQLHPFALKAQTDRVYALGVNRIVYHRYVHQPWVSPAYRPGLTLGAWGMHFERTVTWWDWAGPWIAYQSRCQHLLQRGEPVVDVLFVTDRAPPPNGTRHTLPSGSLMNPEPEPERMPAGWAGDTCGASAFEAFARTADGGAVSPGGTAYRLVLPEGTPPHEVAARLAARGIAPDCLCETPALRDEARFLHRREAGRDWYFIAVANAQAAEAEFSFRLTGVRPSLWDPETGDVRPLAAETRAGRTHVRLGLPPAGAAFVMFDPASVALAAPPPEERPPDEVRDLSRGWRLAFPVDWYSGGTAEKTVALDALTDWTRLDDPDMRHFSGRAVYEKRLDLPGGVRRRGRFVLDLGDVRNLARVTVGGRSWPPLWRPPFRLDVTEGVRACAADSVPLRVEVVNLWANRLIGDESLPATCEWEANGRLKGLPGWVREGRPIPNGRHTFTSWRHWRAGDPLLPSGLLGPVRLEVRIP